MQRTSKKLCFPPKPQFEQAQKQERERERGIKHVYHTTTNQCNVIKEVGEAIALHVPQF